METYTIKKAFISEGCTQLSISASNLYYAEINESKTISAIENELNTDAILERCDLILALIKEIDELNKL